MILCLWVGDEDLYEVYVVGSRGGIDYRRHSLVSVAQDDAKGFAAIDCNCRILAENPGGVADVLRIAAGLSGGWLGCRKKLTLPPCLWLI